MTIVALRFMPSIPFRKAGSSGFPSCLEVESGSCACWSVLVGRTTTTRCEFLLFFLLASMLKGLVPALFSNLFHIFIKDISCQHNVDYELSETLQFFIVGVYGLLEIRVNGVNEKIPSQVDRVLLGNRLVVVTLGNDVLFLD
jgi:hypothetical protein